ncbi:hypothetical protein GCM10009582_13310 [Arthrobacter flavus]
MGSQEPSPTAVATVEELAPDSGDDADQGHQPKANHEDLAPTTVPLQARPRHGQD